MTTADGASVDPRRRLPSVDRLLQASEAQSLCRELPHDVVVSALRSALTIARSGTEYPDEYTVDSLVALARDLIRDRLAVKPRSVINATGVILHTNLGRAPLSADAITAMERVSRGYSALEYDLDTGARGSRHDHAGSLLRELTGAEDALVVNNNASAVLLTLAALAVGREVIISRGELVEIGGGFRIPDVLAQSGARLVEVGTTNRTYADDYDRAATPDTALILRVHASNFQVIGFVHKPTLRDLVDLARRRDIALVDDLGSGTLLETERFGLAHEPTIQESVAAGADLVCFSGDKLLGGPQAGIIVGRRAQVAMLKRHPLVRALRPDKSTIAALSATLGHYARGEALGHIPVWRMISEHQATIQGRATAIARSMPAACTVVETRTAVGGGSLPGGTVPSSGVAISSPLWTAEAIAGRLRAQPTPIIGRVADDRVVLDLRTVDPTDDQKIEAAIRALRSQ